MKQQKIILSLIILIAYTFADKAKNLNTEIEEGRYDEKRNIHNFELAVNTKPTPLIKEQDNRRKISNHEATTQKVDPDDTEIYFAPERQNTQTATTLPSSKPTTATSDSNTTVPTSSETPSPSQSTTEKQPNYNWPSTGDGDTSPGYHLGRAPPAPIAQITHMFLTISLPITLCGIILSVFCIFGLKPDGHLCEKIFAEDCDIMIQKI